MFEDLRTISSADRDVQSFSRVVGGALVLVGIVSLLFGGDRFVYFFVGGGAVLLLGVFALRMLRPVQRIWMMAAIVMGWVMTRIILFFIYYGILTPVGIAAWLLGKRFLENKIDPQASSYWHMRENKLSSKVSYEQQF